MQERVFMGIGNKPFMDIQPSDAAISDRAVNYVLIGRGGTGLLIQLTQSICDDFSFMKQFSPGLRRKQGAVLCGITWLTGCPS